MSATSLPVCVQSGAVAIAAKVGCGQNIACGCHSTAFLAALQPLIYQSCPGPSDALAQAQSFCTAANPSLLDTRRNTIIIPVSIFLGLAIIAVALRFYARRLSKAVLGLDDWLAVGALVFGTVADILVLYGLSNGEATHQFMVSLDREIASNKSSIATGWVTLITILLLKLSILALYHRLFGHLRPFTIAIYIVGSLTAIQTTVNLFIFTFQCKPVAYFWDRAIPGGTCLNFQHIIIGQAASDLATGLTVLLMPAPILWTLHMSGVKRIAIAVVFVIGGFTCISGLLRIPFILAIDDYDIFWTLIPFSVFSCLEINIGVISICLPALRPLIGGIIGGTGFSKQSGSASKQHERLPDSNPKIYTGSRRTQDQGNGAWAFSDHTRTTDSQRALGQESDDETWPMSAIAIKKEVEVERDKSLGPASRDDNMMV